MKFAMQGAQDNGEFFTPPSLVQTIVNVMEPDHGIVWLYRGQSDRFLALMRDYLRRVCAESAPIPGSLAAFEKTLTALREELHMFAGRIGPLERIRSKAVDPAAGSTDGYLRALDGLLDTGSLIPEDQLQRFRDALAELAEADAAFWMDRDSLVANLASFGAGWAEATLETNAEQHAARQAFELLAGKIKGLVKQLDLLHKLTARAGQLARDAAKNKQAAEYFDRAAVNKGFKQLDARRQEAVEQLKLARYFHRQILWLQDRLPDAAMHPVRAQISGTCLRNQGSAHVSRADIPGTGSDSKYLHSAVHRRSTRRL
jgi:type I restriction enzyme M protein